MKRWSCLPVTGIVLCGSLLGTVSDPNRCVAEEPGWITNYPKARAKARKTGKPIFAVIRCER